MCRNVHITLGINLRPGPIRPRTQLNFPTAPQTKNGNNFLLLTSQKINIIIDFFLIRLLEKIFFILYIGNNRNPPITDENVWSLEIR